MDRIIQVLFSLLEEQEGILIEYQIEKISEIKEEMSKQIETENKT